MSLKKEQALVERAEEILLERSGGGPAEKDFRELLTGYKKLLRQSGRLLSMGDRMQAQLNVLNREIAAKEALYRSIFSHVSEGVFRASACRDLVEVNQAMARIFGWTSPAAFVAEVSCVDELFVTDAARKKYNSVLFRHGRVQRYEAAMRRRDGQEVWIQLSAQKLRDTPSLCGESLFVGVALDMTEHRRLVAELSHRANVDGLTNLTNRRHFMDLFRRELNRAQRMRRPLAVMIADIDHFKKVNDTQGHAAGDEVLRTVAECIRQAVRDVDICARLGGEEFVILLPDTMGDAAGVAAERIRRSVQGLSCGRDMPAVTVSIGISVWDSFGTAEELRTHLPDMLLRQADKSLYAAKENGRNRVEIYASSPSQESPWSILLQ